MDRAAVGKRGEGEGMAAERRQEILKLVADGLSSNEPASRLHNRQTALKR